MSRPHAVPSSSDRDIFGKNRFEIFCMILYG
jgi:hypothetical protein